MNGKANYPMKNKKKIELFLALRRKAKTLERFHLPVCRVENRAICSRALRKHISAARGLNRLTAMLFERKTKFARTAVPTPIKTFPKV